MADRLRAVGCIAAEEEAEELIAAATEGPALEDSISRRERGEPLAWITGTTQFCGHSVLVDPRVYVPRQQTEELARRAAALLAVGGDRCRVVDLCTGSGAIAVHLKWAFPNAMVVAVDVDMRAAACARRNGVIAIRGDLDQPLVRGAFDVVTAVAPYVPTADLPFLPADVLRYEPRHALDGGHDGLDLLRRVVASTARLLRFGGWLLIEVGGDQDRRLASMLDAFGFGVVTSWCDTDGDLRGLAAQLIATDSSPRGLSSSIRR
ncbi:MAG: HemK/PrmC family methyltransferase [Acidimicrobiales bacterium]